MAAMRTGGAATHAYRSKDGTEEKVFDALEWLVAMCSHIPDKVEQIVRYYGLYSNVSRGRRKKEDSDEVIPSILEPEGYSKALRKNWARLIQKIYEVDPLTCPKCQGKMHIIAFIENEEVIKIILKHLGLWEIKRRPPPKATQLSLNYSIDDSVSHLPGSNKWLYNWGRCSQITLTVASSQE